MAFHKAKALQDAEKSVSQGKIAQAVRQYQEILDNDPADVSLLNTIGDLYIRDRNITEGLRQFHKLAEAYVREGFNVKAIAIYKKISKVDPNSVDTLLKLAELYQLQGLSREAREQYLQATEFFKKRNQVERALDVLRKLVQLDPENINFRNRLAAECEQAGKREDAAQTYLEAGEILLRRDDQVAAETVLAKASELDPDNSKILIMRARLAITRQKPEEAEKIITSVPQLQSDPAGKRILLDSYLGTRKLAEAEKLVLEVFQSNPTDLSPVSAVSALLVEKGQIEEAYELLAGVADAFINQSNAGPLLEDLRRIWSAAPAHIPTLELIHKLCERTADEFTLPEVLEALGHAHEQAGNLEKAEAAYLKLTEREPENQNYQALLNAVQKTLGRESKPVDFAAKAEAALSPGEADVSAEPAKVDANQEAMVKEALENSDLFSRYNLPEKAIAELEKVLHVYPDQVEIHRRILEISRKGYPERGAVAAAQLARIFSEHGDAETASKYHSIASGKGTLHEIPLPPPPFTKKVEAAVPLPPSAAESPDVETTREFPLPMIASEESVAPPAPPPEPVTFDLAPPSETLNESPAPPPPSPGVSEQTMELDLSGDFESMAAMGFEASAPATLESAAPPVEEMPTPAEAETPTESAAAVKHTAPPPAAENAPPQAGTPQQVPEPPPGPTEEVISVELEDSSIEIAFYLENGFVDEAKQTVAGLEEKYPASQFVAELRRRLDERLNEAAAAKPPAEVSPTGEAVAVAPPAVFEPADEFGVAEPSVKPDQAGEPIAAELPAHIGPAGEIIVSAPAMYSVPAEAVANELPPVEAPPAEAGAAIIETTIPHPAPAHEEWELPTSYAVTAASGPEQKVDQMVPRPAAGHWAPPPANSFSAPPLEAEAGESSGMDMLGDLAGELDASLDGIAASRNASATPTVGTPVPPAPPTAGPVQGVAQLSGLLAEMEEPGGAAAAKDDPETHYNLGVAFREMGLLDEAIGEFQKVVKGAGKSNFPPNFLQACSLLAICFMEKKMPAIAVRWYLRALETPDLDDEALMALQYDLGLAYELADESRRALERFTEVYSQNIDFRDVADKIRELQQKA